MFCESKCDFIVSIITWDEVDVCMENSLSSDFFVVIKNVHSDSTSSFLDGTCDFR